MGVNKNTEVAYRFAHPFFEGKEFDTKTILDHIKGTLEPFPKTIDKGIMTLSEIIGDNSAKNIEETGSISFHLVGDTGHQNGEAQKAVADAMTVDFDIKNPQNCPALFIHLGDVNYYDNTDAGYHAQFYEPYVHYPGKIIAIPGNHDGELFKYDGTSVGQSTSLEAFMKNFCQDTIGIPPAAGSIYRQMFNQPGVYWQLESPFVDVIGLYSNCAENPGFISAPSIGNDQKTWLDVTLKNIKSKRESSGLTKALVIITHHPPLSHSGHSGSNEMLQDIDDSCKRAGLMYNLFVSGHAHNYQRFTRTVNVDDKNINIPYIVAGTGGRGITNITDADGSQTDDYTYDKSLKGYGYLKLVCTKDSLQTIFYQVDDKSGEKSVFDTVTIKL